MTFRFHSTLLTSVMLVLLGALREIGAHIPREATMPYPVNEDAVIAELLARQVTSRS